MNKEPAVKPSKEELIDALEYIADTFLVAYLNEDPKAAYYAFQLTSVLDAYKKAKRG